MTKKIIIEYKITKKFEVSEEQALSVKEQYLKDYGYDEEEADLGNLAEFYAREHEAKEIENFSECVGMEVVEQ